MKTRGDTEFLAFTHVPLLGIKKPAARRVLNVGRGVGRTGLEPVTLCLKGTCSAIELTAPEGGIVTFGRRAYKLQASRFTHRVSRSTFRAHPPPLELSE
jgi:hypothetical protein